MSPIKAQIDYARTQPWFSNYIDALSSCSIYYNGDSIVDLLHWSETNEGHEYWRAINSKLPVFNNFYTIDLLDLQPYLPDYPELFI